MAWPSRTSTATPNEEAIAKRAYELYLQRGSVPGHELDDWLQAEAELSAAAAACRTKSDAPAQPVVRAARSARSDGAPAVESPRVSPRGRLDEDTRVPCNPPAPCNSTAAHGWRRSQALRSRSRGRHSGERSRRASAAARARPRRAVSCWSAAATRCSRSARPAPTTAARWREGLVVGDTVRCPWHHACFDLRTGAPVRAPALNPIPCYDVERADGLIRVGAPHAAARSRCAASSSLRTIAIVGAGAAGESAAETLRREGYDGEILLFGADEAPPVDRPNLSKDYLAGNAPEEWMPLRPPGVLRRAEDRAGARRARDGHRSRRASKLTLRGRARGRLGRAAAGDRAPTPIRPPLPGGRPAARLHAAHAGRQPGHHRPAPRAPSARSSSAPASSAWRWRPRCARAASRSTWSRPRRCRSRARSGPELGGLPARRPRGARRPLPPRADGGRASSPTRVVLSSGERVDRRPGRAGRRRQAGASSWPRPPA